MLKIQKIIQGQGNITKLIIVQNTSEVKLFAEYQNDKKEMRWKYYA